MDQIPKRQKITEESIVNDIAFSVSELSSTITSISKNYEVLLKVNNAVALYMQNAKKRETSFVDEIQSSSKESIEIEQ
uniref:uncharacterized protein LOC117600229 isoform X2 n=1 Tax=Osmia lignaria TaxID=473952 RepID=UPI00147857EF|nr:uncharacterized protein LOC117600229 isoform X2 [Osmia lignaria]